MKLTKGYVMVAGLVPGLVKLIKDWDPGELATELKYRDSLLAFLRAAVPGDCRLEKEYRHSGTTIDIYICWSGLMFKGEVFVEVKRDLNKKATLDRLIGQLETLQPGRHAILVVLVGRTEEALLGRLKAKYKHLADTIVEEPMAVVIKEPRPKSPSRQAG